MVKKYLLDPPGVGLGRNDRTRVVIANVLCDPLAQRRLPSVVDLESGFSEFGGEPAHRGQDEVQPLAVEPAAFDHGGAFDHEHARV